jgi:NAD(P)-dependent dehydrogenase (short-subunit alcohol dehydrogenase family)
LRAAGASVAVHCQNNIAAARELADSLPGVSVAVAADLTDPAALNEAVGTVEAKLGPVGVVVNAAHARLPGACPVSELDLILLQEQLAGVLGHAALCRRVVPGMRAAGSGRIIYVSGALAARPAAGFGAYGAAKSAATTLTKYLALEEGRFGITANVVAPGRVVDEAGTAEMDPERNDLAEKLRGQLALNGFPSPQDVADVIAMFAGPASDAVTGQVVWVTGGEPIG